MRGSLSNKNEQKALQSSLTDGLNPVVVNLWFSLWALLFIKVVAYGTPADILRNLAGTY